ncbi:MAG: phosphotransferase family protein [Turicibacter sp.]|nr:phosphotransferase family protein [Turicibacter sp.]
MEKLIQEIASKALNLKKEEVKISHRLMGGMSNLMYVAEAAGEKYTVRIPGKNAEAFVDRVEEKANIAIVEPLGINNETLFLDTATGYKVAKFVEGTPIGELTDKVGKLPEIASLLKKLHGSGLNADKDYAPYERLAAYEALVREKGVEHSPRYEALKDEFLTYRPLLDAAEKVICHNDSQVSNMVVSGEKTYLLDWEFAGQNDPLYDVACVGNQDFSLAEEFLPIYLGRKPTDEEWRRLYAWRAFQCLQWHNVALFKDLIGLSADLGIDFNKVAAAYLDKAEGFLKQAREARA